MASNRSDWVPPFAILTVEPTAAKKENDAVYTSIIQVAIVVGVDCDDIHDTILRFFLEFSVRS